MAEGKCPMAGCPENARLRASNEKLRAALEGIARDQCGMLTSCDRYGDRCHGCAARVALDNAEETS
jgi:hypothetical protein